MATTATMPAPKSRRVVERVKLYPAIAAAVFALPDSIAGEASAKQDVVPQTSPPLIRGTPGLHVLLIGATDASIGMLEAIGLSVIQIASPPSDRFDPIEVMTAWNDIAAWIRQSRGIILLRSPPGWATSDDYGLYRPGGVSTDRASCAHSGKAGVGGIVLSWNTVFVEDNVSPLDMIFGHTASLARRG